MSNPAGGSSPIGRVGLLTANIAASAYSKPADATQYSLGDMIGNSLTAASVTPITFSAAARFANGGGRLIGAKCTLQCASSTIVLPAFDLLVFLPGTDIPFAAGSYPADNAALNVSASAYKYLVASFSFAADAWRNQAGGVTAAGDVIWQAPKVGGNRPYAPFSVDGLSSQDLIAVMQAQNTWNPGNVAQTFTFSLDVEQD